jgi:hypothetical protein
MMPRVVWAVAVFLAAVATASDGVPRRDDPVPAAVDASAALPDPSTDPVYVCPMDPDVRAHAPGTCRRCGMALVAGVPDPAEFHLDLSLFPTRPVPAEPAVLQFHVSDPWKDRPVSRYSVVHEKLVHAFVVSEDLEFFEHGHPRLIGEGVFQYPLVFPGSGLFRILADFYPEGATPQLITQTVIVPGPPPPPARLSRDYSSKEDRNIRASLQVIPEEPVAGNRTQLRVTIAPAEGLERYLGAWAHMLAASEDLIDMMHDHPAFADGGPLLEFALVFPRPQPYRIWIQVQRDGVVNTLRFDIPVKALD